MPESRNLFCFGYGYSCEYLGHALQQNGGWHIAGTTRDPDKKSFLKKQGIKSFIFDNKTPLDDPDLFLKGTTHLLISTPPGDKGDPAFYLHAKDILNIPTLEWVGYLSSTSVYGNRDGDWVTENAELRPGTKRGSRRVKAEQQWLSLYKKHNLPVHIFRLAGIYGPGRSALDSVRSGTPQRIDKPGHVFNRIHVEDIVRVLTASFAKPAPGTVYNVSDDEAVAGHEVIAHACALIGKDTPALIPFDEIDMAPIARSFYADNKRISNDRIKKELGVSLAYPNYHAGLQACLETEQQNSHPKIQDDA